MAYAWIRRHPSLPIVVTGTGRIAALREAVAALDIQMGAEDCIAFWQASIGHELP